MCRYISFFFNESAETAPDVRVACLYSHGITENWLDLSPVGPYTEGHYLPDGTIECRTLTGRSAASESAVRTRWPSFADFERWALVETASFYDVDGYDRDGYDRDGYDQEGYDWDGFDKNGHVKGNDTCK